MSMLPTTPTHSTRLDSTRSLATWQTPTLAAAQGIYIHSREIVSRATRTCHIYIYIFKKKATVHSLSLSSSVALFVRSEPARRPCATVSVYLSGCMCVRRDHRRAEPSRRPSAHATARGCHATPHSTSDLTLT